MQQSVDVHLLQGGLPVHVDARDRDAALQDTGSSHRGSVGSQLLDALLVGAVRDAAREPAIAESQCAPDGSRRGAGVPKRDGLGGTRIKSDFGVLIIFAFKREVLVSPALPHDGELFFGDFGAGPIFHSECVKLDLKCSDAHRQKKAIPGHVLERVEHQGKQQGMPVRYE